MNRESNRKQIEAKVEAMVDKAFAFLAVEFDSGFRIDSEPA